jgi:hypothetical protein
MGSRWRITGWQLIEDTVPVWLPGQMPRFPRTSTSPSWRQSGSSTEVSDATSCLWVSWGIADRPFVGIPKGRGVNPTSLVRAAARWSAVGLGAAAAAYAAYVGITWHRYGHPSPPSPEEQDPLLDRFIPAYDVVDRHQIHVAAPAAVTLAAARETDMQASPLVRTIITAREAILGATPDDRPRPRGLLAEMQSLGWGVLAEVPGREVVVGSVTKPWEANVTFRALPPDQFAAFSEPGYVKIVWTLRADPIAAAESLFRTETRARATDATARTQFRRYWSFFSPGIVVIRWAVLGPLKKEAERRAGGGGHRPVGEYPTERGGPPNTLR